MDVLVKWEDGDVNVVATRELECIGGDKLFKKGSAVRMLYGGNYFYGQIIDTEQLSSADSSDSSASGKNELKQKQKKPKLHEENVKSLDESSEDELPLNKLIPSTVIDEDELPLAKIVVINNVSDTQNAISNKNEENTIVIDLPFTKKFDATETSNLSEAVSHNDSFFGDSDDTDADPTYEPPTCEAKHCRDEVFAACTECLALLCYEHFINSGPCSNRHIMRKQKDASKNIIKEKQHSNNIAAEKIIQTEQTINETHSTEISTRPEDFVVEGCTREIPFTKNKRPNKKHLAHKYRLQGLEYVSPKTGKTVQAKTLKIKCQSAACKRMGRKCEDFTEEERQSLLDAFYDMKSLQLQREYIVRHIIKEDAKQKTTKSESRRKNSIYYFLPKSTGRFKVCKTMFLNTLCISEKCVRNALDKKEDTGVITKDKRGGRVDILKCKDEVKRQAILDHISRFPKMESHYCRKDSNRDYLHPDLNRRKMLNMFNDEYKDKGISSSYNTYKSVMKTQNLSIFHPKKDQCSLCRTYRMSDQQKKQDLQETFDEHIKQKTAVREKKQILKEDPDVHKVCASFDLQQVLFLPKCNDSKIFYSHRLSNYNFTIYNIKTKDCYCFVWHEGLAKRGSCEIATSLHMYLKILDENNIESVTLFADGCTGQNKNSILPTMLLHSMTSFKSIKVIALLFFEPNHGQNEGDSAHSCISRAVESAGDLFAPSQLVPVFRLARKANPYKVIQLTTNDILDFKETLKTLRVLQVREDDKKNKIDWTTMRELMVRKSDKNKIFFKTSHLQQEYRHITLKRTTHSKGSVNKKSIPSIEGLKVEKLYTEPPKLSQAKYDDLMELCRGPTPVIKLPEHVLFYQSLPH